MTEHQLTILHLSDLHARSDQGAAGPRQTQVLREARQRNRVLGPKWEENLRAMFPDRPPDLIAFTGDLADWGLPAEYEVATEWVQALCRTLGVDTSCFFLVPGNHDIQRTVENDAWKELSDLLDSGQDRISDWIAGASGPHGVDATLVDRVLLRGKAFKDWVSDSLGRPELLPGHSEGAAHPRLGYRHKLERGERPFDVHVIGLDSAWLSGRDNESGRLHLTRHQAHLLAADSRGRVLPGFRLALVHHPLEQLADAATARTELAELVDLVLHGHQHATTVTNWADPDCRLRVLAAGCLYEGSLGDSWPNSCHRIDVVLDDEGRPLRSEVRFRAWSPNGFWHDDAGLYAEACGGRLKWDPWSAQPVRSHGLVQNSAREALSRELESLTRTRLKSERLDEDARKLVERVVAIKRMLREGGQIRVGDMLGHRYLLSEAIGRGGFAAVFRSWDLKRGIWVAVKVLHPQFQDDSQAVERFERGARTMGLLRHDSIVRVLEPVTKDQGYRYFVMEHFGEGDLHSAVLDGRLTRQQTLDVLLDIGAALAFAHERGIVHRDVKPQNVLLSDSGKARLTDFDLVKVPDSIGYTVGALGTFMYAAPETLAGDAVDERADVFSLAMTTLFALNGGDVPRSAYGRNDVVDFLGTVACSDAMKDVLQRALAWAPRDRTSSMGDFCAGLREAHLDTSDADAIEAEVDESAQVYYAQSAKDLLHGVFESITERAKNRNPVVGMPTGLRSLDLVTTGLHAGEVSILAGEPSTGKTALVLCIARNLALLAEKDSVLSEDDRPVRHQVILCGRSLTSHDVVERILHSDAVIDHKRLRSGRMVEDEFAALVRAADRLYKAPVWFDDRSSTTADVVREVKRIRELEDVGGDLVGTPGLLIVDSLESYVDMTMPAHERGRALAGALHELAMLARDCRLHVLAVVQLEPTSGERRHDPTLASLHRTMPVQNDVDTVLFLHEREPNESQISQRRRLKLTVAKHRYGSPTSIDILLDETFSRFCEGSDWPDAVLGKDWSDLVDSDPAPDDDAGIPE